MQRTYLFVICYMFSISSYSQTIIQNPNKPALDLNILGKWPGIDDPCISNNGKYVSYRIYNKPFNNQTLVIQSTDSKWTYEITGVAKCLFSGDNKCAVFMRRDTLYVLNLGNKLLEKIPNVQIYKTPFGTTEGKWMAYLLKGSKELTLINLITRKTKSFLFVDDFSFNQQGNVLLLRQSRQEKENVFNSLIWIDLVKGDSLEVWKSSSGNIRLFPYSNFDFSGNQLAFTVNEVKNNKPSNSIWYFKRGMQKAALYSDDQANGLDSLKISNYAVKFSGNGQWIFFMVSGNNILPNNKLSLANVSVWSYHDLILQPEVDKIDSKAIIDYKAVISNEGGRVYCFNKGDERIINELKENEIYDYVVVSDQNSNQEYWWKLSPQPSIFIQSLKNGTRQLLKKESSTLLYFSFSPTGKYLVYWDKEVGTYFSYDVSNGAIRDLIPENRSHFWEPNFSLTNPKPVNNGLIGWTENDLSFLVYDNYDIWEIDPLGKVPPINLTLGFGSKNRIKLRLVNEKVTFKGNEEVLLTGLSEIDKCNYLYKWRIGKKQTPELLTGGKYTFYHSASQVSGRFQFDKGMPPLKAANANVWIVKRQSAVDAPNYFITKDFKEITPLTDLHPQKDYNWLTTELVSWKMFNGKEGNGILYKPENFDSTKKYPIIFNYYEQLSHRLYEFPSPELIEHNIDIPYFVSNGYLVFTPDIYYELASKSGKPVGEWAYNAVVSAAEYLSKRTYVDNTKMAIQGHSFGAQETNYIVTHTNIFAAASEFAGVTDPISAYLTLVPFADSIEHLSRQNLTEFGHEIYGATPWDKPDLYRLNSAVLSADRVTTPLLIVHNVKDNQIQWRQGIELFMALRRLHKKVWMLNYAKSGHVLTGNEAIDHTIRLKQYFDYFLKGSSPPKWMTEYNDNVKKIKNIDYSLDYSGSLP